MKVLKYAYKDGERKFVLSHRLYTATNLISLQEPRMKQYLLNRRDDYRTIIKKSSWKPPDRVSVVMTKFADLAWEEITRTLIDDNGHMTLPRGTAFRIVRSNRISSSVKNLALGGNMYWIRVQQSVRDFRVGRKGVLFSGRFLGAAGKRFKTAIYKMGKTYSPWP